MSFDFAFPSQSIESPPLLDFSFDTSLLELPYSPMPAASHYGGHTRSSSKASVYSAVSTVDSTPESVCTRISTPPRASPPVRHHGPLLLPKIRSQDQQIDNTPRHFRTSTPPAPKPFRHGHARSYTNPETLGSMGYASGNNFNVSFGSQPDLEQTSANSLLCSPIIFAQDSFHDASMSQSQSHSRRGSSCSIDASTIDKYGYPTYRQLPTYNLPQQQQQQQADFVFPQQCNNYSPRAPSPLSLAATSTPDPTPSTTLMAFLTAPNPAASLVRTISFPLRDPNTKHFWWDVRNIRSWSGFNASTVMALPGAAALLNAPVPCPVLPQPSMPSRHPETEASLHSIYANYYLPKLNAALAISSSRPMSLSVPPRSKTANGINDLLFVGTGAGESVTAAAMFGGKPTARVVGLVRTFDRFNTGMRVEGNIKRVEYLRGLAALHHAMREHSCRYGFILTEIELVIVRNGVESTPFFGNLEVTSVQLAATASENTTDVSETPLTACLALWGLCQLAKDEPQAGHPSWRAEIGAPAEGTRRKAHPRDSWMPPPQLAEKREAKRARGWVFPEDAIGRKELGKRGVKYGGF